MILNSDDILSADVPYAFTYTGAKLTLGIFEPSEQSVKDGLAPLMVNFGDVTNVARGFFSGRFVITVVPHADYYLKDWLGAFNYSFQQMGWTNTSFVQAEGGTKSTKPGGVSQVVSDSVGAVGGAIGGGLSNIIKPLAPYLVVGAAALLAFEYMRGRK